jgi:hypothetical protein
MKCELCKNPAIVECIWGLYERSEPIQKAELCSTCADSLWHKCKGAVNAGFMYWLNKTTKKDL